MNHVPSLEAITSSVRILETSNFLILGIIS
jgi:hypothetical protein